MRKDLKNQVDVQRRPAFSRQELNDERQTFFRDDAGVITVRALNLPDIAFNVGLHFVSVQAARPDKKEIEVRRDILHALIEARLPVFIKLGVMLQNEEMLVGQLVGDLKHHYEGDPDADAMSADGVTRSRIINFVSVLREQAGLASVNPVDEFGINSTRGEMLAATLLDFRSLAQGEAKRFHPARLYLRAINLRPEAATKTASVGHNHSPVEFLNQFRNESFFVDIHKFKSSGLILTIRQAESF